MPSGTSFAPTAMAVSLPMLANVASNLLLTCRIQAVVLADGLLHRAGGRLKVTRHGLLELLQDSDVLAALREFGRGLH